MADSVFFWATLSRNVPGKPVAYTQVSPSFGMQPDLVGWVRTHRQDGDEVSAWKRTIRGQDFTDERLNARDDSRPDPARLRAIMAELGVMLDAKKRDLDRGRGKRAA